MFLAAYATSLTSYHGQPSTFFILGGFILSIVWLFLQRRIFKNLGTLQKKVKQWSPFYRSLAENRNEAIPSNWIIANVIPFLFIVFWIYLYLR